MLTGLTKINSGYIRAGKRIVAKKGSAAGLHKLRQRAIGFVAADPVYMQDMTIYENFLLTDRGKGSNKAKQTNAREILKLVGLKGMGRYYPKEMTSIEKLKASVARAILNNPVMLVCDDPSEDLLYKNYDNDIEDFMNLLEMINRDLGITILIATSNPNICKRCKKTVAIHEGVDVREFNKHPKKVHKKHENGVAETDIDDFVVDLRFMDEEAAATETAAAVNDVILTDKNTVVQKSVKKAEPAVNVTVAKSVKKAEPVNRSVTPKAVRPSESADKAVTPKAVKSAESAANTVVSKTVRADASKMAKTPKSGTVKKPSAALQITNEQAAAEKAAMEAMAAVKAATNNNGEADDKLPEIDLTDLF
jgi:ABC-type ATPase involved in cell division